MNRVRGNSRLMVLGTIAACFAAAVAERIGAPHFPTLCLLLAVVLVLHLLTFAGRQRG